MTVTSDDRPGGRVTLRVKLVIAAVAVVVVMCTFLLAYFGPLAEDSFVARSEDMITETSGAMRELAKTNNENSQQLLYDLIRHSAEARRRALQDIPFSLYNGDIEQIRQAIDEHDSARADRLHKNVRVLGKELQRRADQKISRHMNNLTSEQRNTSEAFGSDLRTSYLVLSGGLLFILVVFFALGLDRLIVRPVYELRRATRLVANGDLAVRIDRRSRDELGDLAGDFSVMVDQLRASEREIQDKNQQLEDWNTNLQKEVQSKTSHLEATLADLRAAQHKLVHADKMASVGTLAGGVAHEFNNLIGGIRGCIADVLVDETVVDRREPLEVAMRATQRAASITEKLLRFARPRIEDFETVALDELVTEVVDLVEPQARRQAVSVEVRVPPGIRVAVNPGEMHQVFLNLFTNALQAMPTSGVLVVAATRVGGSIKIDVADTGVGIPAAEIARIFDPFYTARVGSDANGRVGSGLGLSVSFGIVEAHGGVLSVESKPGVGSTFTVTLSVTGSQEDGK